MATVEEINIPVPWGHVAAKGWNDPTSPPVLLVHAFLDNAGSFDRLIPLLPNNFYYVAIDLPGHSLSSHLNSGVPLNHFHYVKALDYVADHFKWDKFTLIGHSSGGYMSYSYSAIFPDRVTKLVILDEPFRVFDPQGGVNNLLDSFEIVKETERFKASGQVTSLLYPVAVQRIITVHPQGLTIGSAHDLAKRLLVKSTGNGYTFALDHRMKHAQLPRMNVEQSMEFLKRIKCPMLQIAASDSLAKGTMKPAYEDYQPLKEMFESRLGKSYRFEVVDGNNAVHMDYPERVSGPISEFLTNP